jgi:hypothetical protein
LRARKILKKSGIVLLILAVLFTCFHFWFINRSVGLLQDFVTTQSKGKYRLTIGKLRYNYAKLIFQLDKPVLTCLDSLSEEDKYNVTAGRVTINLKQLLPLLFKKELRFDAVYVDQPQIQIIHQKEKEQPEATDKEVNISQDMFNAYASLRNALGQLQADRFTIHQGAFSIINVRQPVPLQISGIDFAIKGLNINPEETPTYDPLAVTDSIGLAIAGQQILFPDGKKSIAFKSFRFNSVLGSITLDSFQVISRSNTTQNNFNIFADRLSLKKFRLVAHDGSDFTLIDSVFFTRPVAKLVLETGGKNKSDSAADLATTLRNVVQTVTGNGTVNYIGINNVKFDITTLRNDKESNFSFVQDRLELGELHLNKDSIAPVTVGSLRFGLKRYVNYFNDSAYFIQFDSIRILDGQLALYNFELQSTPKAPQLQRVQIPVLLLTGIDWYRLLFENRFAAKNISLYNPQITVSAPSGGGKRGQKQSLRDLLSVDHLLMQNANINVLFSKGEYAQVKSLSMDANTGAWFREPTFAATMAMMQGTGANEITLVKSGWNVRVTGPKLSDTGVALIPSFSVVNRQKNIVAKGENLRITGLQVNEAVDKVTIGSIGWKSLVADIALPPKKSSGAKDTANQPSISIAAIRGGTAKLRLRSAAMDAMVDLASVQTGNIALHAGKLDTLADLTILGNQWSVAGNRITAKGSRFNIAQQKESKLMDVQVSTKPPGEAIDATIPEIAFAGDMEKVACG